MITARKKQAVEGMATTFLGKAETAALVSEAEVERLHAKIGQLVVERGCAANIMPLA